MNNHQRGLSLVELMIAIALSSLMLLGVLQVFDANKRTSTITSNYARVQESGRMAIEMIVRDIRMADAWGCVSIGTGDILDHLDSADSDYDPYLSLVNAAGLAGSDNVVAGTAIDSINVKPGTDTLTLRGAKPLNNVKIVDPYMNVNAARIHMNAGVDIPLGTVLLISDCNGADLFSSTGTNTTSGNLNHNMGTITAPGAVDNAIKDMSHTYGPNAQILIPFVKTYFVGATSGGGWSLYRRENGTTFELVRNVEDLQIIYGEDTGADGSADTFSDAVGVADMEQVIAVRASLVAQSESAIAGGQPLSRTYEVTTNIRNRAL